MVFTFKDYNAEWDYRFGWGYYSGIVPEGGGRRRRRQLEERQRHRPVPCSTDFVQGNSDTYIKNPNYWDKEKIGGDEYKLPFVDKIVYRTIKDEATFLTALRTGKLDMLEAIRWSAVDELKKSAPQLKWSQWLDDERQFLAMRVDTKPFDDIRVRRALNMAVNKQEIVKAYYGGNAELFAYPQHPDYHRLFRAAGGDAGLGQGAVHLQPREGEEAAGRGRLPNGFSFKVQVCSCSPDHMDLLPLVAAYLEKVGVKIEIQPMEYGAFLSAMTTQDQRARLFHEQRPHQPDHHHPQELRAQGRPGIRRNSPTPPTTRRWTRSISSATRASARPCSRR